jgi:CRP-like cAMP-binding protein
MRARQPPTDVSLPDSLLARSVERHLAKGEVLWVAGSEARGLFIVLEGEVRVTRGGGGRQHIIHVEGPGGTLGEVPLFSSSRYPATAIASAPTRCLVIGRAELGQAITEDPGVAWFFLQRMARRIHGLVDRLDRLAGQSVASGLATFLLQENTGAGSPEIRLSITQAQLAEDLGTVREVLVRALRSLRERGMIASLGRNRFRITDRPALERLATPE